MSLQSSGTNQPFKTIGLEDVALWMPSRKKRARSGENGVVLVVGGSVFKHGQAVLAALAALVTGVDEVYVAVPERLAAAVRSLTMDCNVIPLPDYKLTRGAARRLLKWIRGRINAALIGVALQKGSTEGAAILAQELAVNGVKLTLSSEGACNDVLSRVPNRQFIATYSRKSFEEVFKYELTRIKDTLDLANLVRETAKTVKGCILLKGPEDIVSDGSTIYVNVSGTPAMTVSGAGAIVDGLAVGLLGRGLDPLRAGAIAAYVAGVAGEMATSEKGYHVKASDILEKIPKVLMRFDTIKEA